MRLNKNVTLVTVEPLASVLKWFGNLSSETIIASNAFLLRYFINDDFIQRADLGRMEGDDFTILSNQVFAKIP